MTCRVSLVEFERAFDDTIARIDAGETVVVTRDGRGYVKLVPLAGYEDDDRRSDHGG